jgi:hypothetical protein
LVALLGWCCFFSLSLAGCGGGGQAGSSRAFPLPEYDRAAKQLFDNGFDAGALGLGFDTLLPSGNDRLLRERTQTADSVVRARIVTVTSQKDGAIATSQIAMTVLQDLAGQHPQTREFVLQVAAEDPANGTLKALQGGLVGKTFVVFLREFAAAGGQSAVHFHVSRDDPDMVNQVQAAALSIRLR